MDYNILLDLATELGYRLAMCGAETFRVEESINLVLKSYGIEAESFAIPNCLTVSLVTEDGKPMTRMRRIGVHGNDLDSVERYSNLSRRICADHPEPSVAMQWLKETDATKISYSTTVFLIGNFLGAAGFAVIFGSSLLDCLLSGICGIAVGFVNLLMDKWKANQFFRTIIAAFLLALLAYALAASGVSENADTVIIGALMILVPGLLFTNAMRDIIYGDTNSGLNRVVQVFLIAAAIALGTGAAWQSAAAVWRTPESIPALTHTLPVQLVACAIGCLGFAIQFNIHGPGGLLCILGGIFSWGTYCVVFHFTQSDLTGYFAAAVVSSIYSELMARIRKYPAISYLVVSIFPLIPGASVYYTMNHAVRGDMSSFADRGMHTVAIAGVIAVGILLVSTIFRIWSVWKRSHTTK